MNEERVTTAEATGGSAEAESAPLLAPGIWVKPGPATLIVRPAGWAILPPSSKKPTIEATWKVLGADPVPERILESIAEEAGLDSVDRFREILIGIVTDGEATVVVKGRAAVGLYDGSGSQLVAGTSEDPIATVTSQGVRRLAFGELPPEQSLGGLRITEGVVRAAGFVQMISDPEQMPTEDRAALAEQVEAHGRSIASPEDKAAKAARAPAPPPPTPVSSPDRGFSTAPAVPRASASAPAARGGAKAASNAASAGPSIFDDLFGAQAAAPDVPGPEAPTAPVTAEPAALDDGPDAKEDEQTRAEPAASPAAPIPDPAPAESTEAERAAPQPAAPQKPVEDAQQQPPRRRRLLSTSLFDRPQGASRPGAVSREESVAQAPQAVAASAGPAPATPEQDAPQPEPEPDTPSLSPPSSESIPASSAPPTQISAVDEDEEDDAPRQPTPRPRRPAPAPQDSPAPAAGREEMPEATGTYDVLFGPTVFRRIEDAAVRRSEEDDEHEDMESSQEESSTVPEPLVEGAAATAQDESPSALPPVKAPSAESTSAKIGDFIDWVPGVGREAPEIAQAAARRAAQPSVPPPAYPQVHLAERPEPPVQPHAAAAQRPQVMPQRSVPAQQSGPHQGGPPPQSAPPVRSASLPRSARPPQSPPVQLPPGQRMPVGQPATAPSGPVVLSGLVCRHGHANPPERPECRYCGEALVGPARPVPRPPLGYVEISTGETFRLDRSAIIGRKPRVSRVSGSEVPQLITVPSPQQDISRNHLELRLEGWHVVALDLGATNGSTLIRPEQDPERLAPSRGVVLHDLDVLDLGDGIRMRMREGR